ncbi:hypothetical protein WJX72_003557 [[Myrmecia] bisecta]|uniref:RING-type E3 ubiquitin transferase n=1 Tax=[Myrmecia] bisecta TaxID=41462 RepID=A0AAW1Q8L4_9CHLO
MAEAQAAEPPSEYCCPISEEVMQEPVLLVETGQTFERQSIENWFRCGRNTCPMTGKVLVSTQLVPNYVVKSLIRSWAEKHGLPMADSPAAGIPAGQAWDAAAAAVAANGNVAYPDLNADASSVQDRLGQVRQILDRLRSPSMAVAAFRQANSYPLWQLKELAGDGSCRDAISQGGGIALLLSVLGDARLPECQASASAILGRVCAGDPAAAAALVQAGGTEGLVRLLSSPDEMCRRSAAYTLCFLGRAGGGVRDDIYTLLCQQSISLANVANPIVPLCSMLVSESDPECVAAICLLHMLSDRLPASIAGTLICTNTGVLPSIARQLGNSDDVGRAAASGLLRNLAAAAPNRPELVTEVVHVLSVGSDTAREAGAALLWGLAAPAPGITDSQLMLLCAQNEGFLPALVTAMATGGAAVRLVAAGLLQHMTFEDNRPRNRVVSGPNQDDVRLKAVSQEGLLPSLAAMLQSEDQQQSAAAGHAVANLAAYRSGICSVCQAKSKYIGGFALPTFTPCTHSPPLRLTSHPEITAQLLQMLEASTPGTISIAVAALSNILAADEARDRLREELRQTIPHVVWRLQQLFSLASLSGRTKEGARTIMQRLDLKDRAGSVQYSFITLLLPPPPQPRVLPTPY